MACDNNCDNDITISNNVYVVTSILFIALPLCFVSVCIAFV